MPKAEKTLAIYVHWPYCERICPYCDFNVYKNKKVDDRAWINALKRDLRFWADHSGNRDIVSIYFGGGTPSLMPVNIIEAVLAEAAYLWHIDSDVEVTIEANPSDTEISRFRDFRAAGVNRLSLGVQSFDDADLTFLGRNHNAKSARAALTLGLNLFEHVSFDLIYALPEETTDKLSATLDQALSFGAGHLSPYQLTIEPNTAFEKAVHRGRWSPVSEERGADLYDLVQETLDTHHMPAYEISNHARPGEESKHNMTYWLQRDYLGIGPGAHGRLTTSDGRFATECVKLPARYLAPDCLPVAERLSPESILVERVTMGLRLRDGVTMTKTDIDTLGARMDKALILQKQGFLEIRDRSLRATSAGRRVLNSVTTELLT